MPTTDEDARHHMAACPDHEVTVNEADEWVCLTCEEEQEASDERAVWFA